jgi:hypothetical protein
LGWELCFADFERKKRKKKKIQAAALVSWGHKSIYSAQSLSKLMALSASNGPPGRAGQILVWAERYGLLRGNSSPQVGLIPPPFSLHRACALASKAQELGSIAKSLEAYEIFQIGMKTSPRVFCSASKWKWNIWVKAKHSPDLHLISTQM